MVPCLALPCLVLSCFVMSCLVLSLFCPVLSCPAPPFFFPSNVCVVVTLFLSFSCLSPTIEKGKGVTNPIFSLSFFVVLRLFVSVISTSPCLVLFCLLMSYRFFSCLAFSCLVLSCVLTLTTFILTMLTATTLIPNHRNPQPLAFLCLTWFYTLVAHPTSIITATLTPTLTLTLTLLLIGHLSISRNKESSTTTTMLNRFILLNCFILLMMLSAVTSAPETDRNEFSNFECNSRGEGSWAFCLVPTIVCLAMSCSVLQCHVLLCLVLSCRLASSCLVSSSLLV